MEDALGFEVPPLSSRENALAIGTVALLLAAFAAVALWAMHDADQEERAALIADTADPQTFEVSAGWFSEAGAIEEMAAYYPDQLKAHPGDVVRFVNPTTEDPHSVTFGLRPDRSNQPRFGTGDALAIVNAPCAMAVPLRADTRQCLGEVSDRTLPEFTGQPFFNSGIIAPGGGMFDLRLSAALQPGTYPFFCVIHPEQTGELEIVPEGEPTQRPGTLATAARRLLEGDREEMRRLELEATSGRLNPSGPQVQAGAATARASRNQFLPAEISINASETVTWTNDGSVPHVMIFGGFLPPPDAVTAPPTRPSGSSIGRGLFTTGPIGAPPYPRTSFTLRFDRPGSYSYVCTFHPGMAGTVLVR